MTEASFISLSEVVKRKPSCSLEVVLLVARKKVGLKCASKSKFSPPPAKNREGRGSLKLR
jgi:hypothetical protein